MKIAGTVQASLTIDGQPAEQLGIVMQEAVQRHHVWYYLPTADIRVLDLKKHWANGVPDGQQFQLQLMLADDPSGITPPAVTYSLFKAAQGFNAEFGTFTLSAYLAAGHQYLMERVSKSYAGNASDVVSAVMSEAGMQATVISTTDSQTWRAENLTRAEFLHRQVLPSCYPGADACAMAGVSDLTGRFTMVDLMQAVTQPPRYKIANVPIDGMDYFAVQSKYYNNSGFMNKLGGYGYETRARNMVTATTDTYDQVQVRKSQSALNVATDLLTTAHVAIPTLFIGNDHVNVHRATHQNARIAGTFTNFLDLLVRQTTQVDLFDVVEVTIRTPAGADSVASGRYVCIGRARAFNHREYAEKLCLVSNSVNNNQGLVA